MRKYSLLLCSTTFLLVCSAAYAAEFAKSENGFQATLVRQGEFMVDTNAIYGPAFYGQWDPVVAFDGSNHFVVWQDWRDPSSIYGTRVDQSGTVLDSNGICVTPSGVHASVASDNYSYLVAWSDEDEYWLSGADLLLTRVDSVGNVLDSIGFPISTAPSMQIHSAIAFDGTNYLVVWEDWRNHYVAYPDIYAARISQSGTVLDPNGIVISAGPNNRRYPSVAFDGSNYLIVWQDDRNGMPEIYAARIKPDGVVLDQNGIAIATATDTQPHPYVSFGSTNYLIVWQDQNNGLDIYGVRVDTAVNVLDSMYIPISIAANDQERPTCSFDGTNFLAVWEDYRSCTDTSNIYGARVDQSGNILDPSGIEITNAPSSQETPTVSFGTTDYLVLWEDSRTEDIYGARVAHSGYVVDTTSFLVSKSTNFQEASSVAFDGTNYFVVWHDWRGGTWDGIDIYGIRITQSGLILDSMSFAISSSEHCQFDPAVAFNNTYYLVAWQDYRGESSSIDIYAARVDTSGNILDTAGIPVSIADGDQESVAIASCGNCCLAVWEDSRSGSDIYGARIDESGYVLDTLGIVISTPSSQQNHPDVAFDGTNYFVVWCRNSSIYGARVDQSGIVLDSVGFQVGMTYGWQWHPAVAFDGTNYLVVWTNYPGYEAANICGARVNQNGVVLDSSGITISTALTEDREPVICFNGTHYVVAWEDWRDGLAQIDIYGALVDTNGSVVYSFCINNASKQQVVNGMAHGMDDQALITYTGWAGTVGGKTYDSKRIWGKFYPFVGLQEDPAYEVHDAYCHLMVKPNPFTNTTQIQCIVDNPQPLTDDTNLEIYDASGRHVKDLPISLMTLRTTLSWDGFDNHGRRLPSGVYFIRFECGNSITTEKLLLIR